MKSTKNIFVLFVLIQISEYSFAQGGSAGAQELLIPVGARSFGLNSSFVAGTSGLEAIYYNPSGLAYNTGSIDAMFTYMSYIADINLSYAAAASSLGDFGTVALSMKSLDFGDIPVTTTQQPYGTGELFSPTFIVASLSYARSISSSLSIGFNTNIIFEKIIETSATGVSFDFGFQYANVGFEGLRIGAVLKNIGPSMSFDGADLLRTVADTGGISETQILKIDPAEFDLPTTLDIGLTYITQFQDKYNFLLSTSVSNSSYINNQIKFGGELNYDNMFFVRGGYHINLERNDKDKNIYGPAFGLGLKLKTIFSINFDYAYRITEFFASNQMFSVVIGF